MVRYGLTSHSTHYRSFRRCDHRCTYSSGSASKVNHFKRVTPCPCRPHVSSTSANAFVSYPGLAAFADAWLRTGLRRYAIQIHVYFTLQTQWMTDKQQWSHNSALAVGRVFRWLNRQLIIIIITTTMFTVLSSWQSHCESSLGSFDECRMAPSGRRPKTKPDDLESACTGCQNLHPPSPFIIITQPESWYSFYHPTEGRKLSRPS